MSNFILGGKHMNMFTKFFLIGLVLITMTGFVSAETMMSLGTYTNGFVSGGEFGVDLGRVNLALRGGGKGLFMDTPTVDVYGDMSDSTGYTDAFEDSLFPMDGQSLKANTSSFNLELRGSFDVVSLEYFAVFLGTGVGWTRTGISGEYVMNEEGDSISVEGSMNDLNIPLFAGMEVEPFDRAPGFVLGVEGGYSLNIPLNVNGSMTMYDYDDVSGDWIEVTYGINVKPNTYMHGFFGDVYVKYRW